MLTFKNEDARGIVSKNLGAEAGKVVEGLDFQPFPELEQAVKDDVALLKKTPVVANDVTITGWVYEVETGKVRQVV
jgi:carbonic anhydrase